MNLAMYVKINDIDAKICQLRQIQWYIGRKSTSKVTPPLKYEKIVPPLLPLTKPHKTLSLIHGH